MSTMKTYVSGIVHLAVPHTYAAVWGDGALCAALSIEPVKPSPLDGLSKVMGKITGGGLTRPPRLWRLALYRQNPEDLALTTTQSTDGSRGVALEGKSCAMAVLPRAQSAHRAVCGRAGTVVCDLL